MAYVLPVVVFLLAYNKERSRTVTVLILIYMWILVGLNTYTPDYAEYERVYYNPTIWDVEYGYRLLCDFFREFGCDYQQFRMIFGLIYVLTIYRGINNNTEYSNMVLALYLLWPFIPSVSSARFSFAVAIFYNAVPYLYNKKRFSTLKYILIIGLSFLFHMGSIVFLAYLFARKKFTNKQYLVSILLIFFTFLSIKLGLLERMAYALNIWRIIKWLSMSTTDIGRLNIFGFIYYSAILIANFYITSQVGKLALRSADCNTHVNTTKELGVKRAKYNLLLNINFLSLFIIPFYLISSEYLRYLHATLMLNYCLFAGFKNEQCNIEWRNKAIYNCLFIFTIVITASFYIYSQSSHNIFATLVDNLLFQE